MRLPYHRAIIAGCFLGFALCMTVIFCGCASSTLGRALNVGVGAARLADISSTHLAKAHGGVEGNPLVGTGNLRQAVVSVLGASIVIAGTLWLENRNHRVLAQVIRGAMIAVWSAAAVHNYRLARTR